MHSILHITFISISTNTRCSGSYSYRAAVYPMHNTAVNRTYNQNDNIRTVGRGVRSYEKMMDPKRSMRFLGVAPVDDHEAIRQRLQLETPQRRCSSFFSWMTEVRPGNMNGKSISSVKARWKALSSVLLATLVR